MYNKCRKFYIRDKIHNTLIDLRINQRREKERKKSIKLKIYYKR